MSSRTLLVSSIIFMLCFLSNGPCFFLPSPRPREGTKKINERAIDLNGKLSSGFDNLTDRQYRHYVDKLVQETYPKCTPLEETFRKEWAMVNITSFFYISIPWRQIFEEDARVADMTGTSSRRVPEAMEFWMKLDWRRTHFVIFSQLNFEQINFFTWKSDRPDFKWNRDTLVVFDSRLSSISTALRGHVSPSHLFPIPLINEAQSQSFGFQSFRNCSVNRSILMHFSGSIDLQRRFRGAVLERVRHHYADRSSISLHIGKLNLSRFTSALCQSVWVLCVSGTFPPTFMIYEAMHAGALPIFVISPHLNNRLLNSTREGHGHIAQLRSDQLDYLMPFGDEGVKFSKFGAVLPADHPNFLELLDGILNSTPSEVRQRQAYLASVVHRYTPTGTFQYALRTASRSITTSTNQVGYS